MLILGRRNNLIDGKVGVFNLPKHSRFTECIGDTMIVCHRPSGHLAQYRLKPPVIYTYDTHMGVLRILLLLCSLFLEKLKRLVVTFY